VQYNCKYNYTNITQKFCCIAAVRTSAIQLQYKVFLELLQIAYKFSAGCRKLVLQRCITGVRASVTELQYKKKFLYCSCIVVILHLCGPLKGKIFSLGFAARGLAAAQDRGLEPETYALLCEMWFSSTAVWKSSAKDNKPLHNLLLLFVIIAK